MHIQGSSRSGGARRSLVRALVPLAAVAMGATVLAACQLPGSTFVVTTTVDGTDSDPGDGVCETALGNDICTVRAAVMEANATPGTNNIELGNSLTYVLSLAGPDEDGSATGDLDISGSVAINGTATIDANGIDRVLDVRAETLILDGPSITGGVLPFGTARGGGIRVATGAALVTNAVTIHDNEAWSGGGGIDASGPVTLLSSAVRDNRSVGQWDLQDPLIPAPGGGISMHSASLTVNRSAITGNVVANYGDGGGIHADGASPITIEASTLTGNAVDSFSSVAAIDAGTVTLRSSTVVDNPGRTVVRATNLTMASSTVTNPSGIAIDATTGSATGSIIAAGLACSDPLTSQGYNVASDASCGLAGIGDQSSTDPSLFPLTDNGGPTRTRLPYADSPVVDAIPVGTPGLCTGALFDQRGEARPDGPGCDIGAVEGNSPLSSDPLALVVDEAGDGTDVFAGDGTCATATGTCTLRAAIEETNVWPEADSITIAPGVDPVVGYELAIADDLTIDGAGRTVNAIGAYGYNGLRITAGTVALHHVTLTGTSGSLVLVAGDVTLTDSQATFALVLGHSTLEVLRSTLGGMWTRYGATSIVQSTITGPIRSESWGGSAPTVSVLASTLDNGDGETSAILVEGAPPVHVRGSIIEGRGTFGACGPGAIVSGGYNVISDESCNAASVGDQIDTDPLLGVLGDNGGPTPTRQPYLGSPAVDAIPMGTVGLCDAALQTDQRGEIRPDGGACDVGSVEGHSWLQPTAPLVLVVNTALDARDANPGDGVCTTVAGPCTLRAAIDEANAWPPTDIVTIAPGINPTLTIPGTQEHLNATGDLDIGDSVIISGGGATIDGNRLDGVIDHVLGTATITGVTIRGGGSDLDDSTIAGVRSKPQATMLTIQDSVITDNERGGIYSQTHLAVAQSSITANGGMGGISTDWGTTASIDRSTVSGNSYQGLTLRGLSTVTRSTIIATTDSAVAVTGTSPVEVNGSTIMANSPSGTLRIDGVGTLVVRGSVFNGIGGLACFGTVTSAGYNRYSQGGCSLHQVGDLKVPDVGLGPLAANGGPTLTRMPNATSTVLDVIPIGTAGLCDGTVTTDQRNLPRPQGAGCDIGAVERTP